MNFQLLQARDIIDNSVPPDIPPVYKRDKKKSIKISS